MTPGWIVSTILFIGCLFFLTQANKRSGTPAIELCPIKRCSGLPCPLCGGTTSGFLLLRGEVSQSLRTNPLVSIGLLSIAAWSLIWLTTGFRIECTLSDLAVAMTILTLFAANWIYVLWHFPGG